MENSNLLNDELLLLIEELIRRNSPNISTQQPSSSINMESAARSSLPNITETPNIPTTTHQSIVNERINQDMEILGDFMYIYNQNFRNYNQNIREMIQLYDNIHLRHNNIIRNNSYWTSNLINETPRTPSPTPVNIFSSSIPINNTRPRINTNTILSHIFNPLTELFQRNQETPILTNQQIQLATENYVFNGEVTENNTCPICLEEFTEGDILIKIRGCGHIFKSSHLLNWFNRNSGCPVCRYDLRRNIDDPSHNEIPRQEPRQEPIINNLRTANRLFNNLNTENPEQYIDELSRMFFGNFIPNNLENSDSSFDESGNLIYTFNFPTFDISMNFDVD